MEFSGTVTEKVSEIREKGIKDGLSSMVNSFSSPSLGNYSNYGHEKIPDSDPTERSTLYSSETYTKGKSIQ